MGGNSSLHCYNQSRAIVLNHSHNSAHRDNPSPQKNVQSPHLGSFRVSGAELTVKLRAVDPVNLTLNQLKELNTTLESAFSRIASAEEVDGGAGCGCLETAAVSSAAVQPRPSEPAVRFSYALVPPEAAAISYHHHQQHHDAAAATSDHHKTTLPYAVVSDRRSDCVVAATSANTQHGLSKLGNSSSSTQANYLRFIPISSEQPPPPPPQHRQSFATPQFHPDQAPSYKPVQTQLGWNELQMDKFDCGALRGSEIDLRLFTWLGMVSPFQNFIS